MSVDGNGHSKQPTTPQPQIEHPLSPEAAFSMTSMDDPKRLESA
jgi:hypothetical protein